MNALQIAVADGMTIAKRNALKIRRAPDLLGGVVMLPIVFVLLFGYIFGSMIDIPGMTYGEYMLPGIFVMTIVTSAQITGYTLTLDLQKGIFDRFRTLPMSSSAVLTGQTVSDVIMNLTSLVTMAVVGLVVGWRIHTSPFEAALGFLLLLFFSYAFSWVTATVALALRTPEIFNNVATIVSLPLVFLSNAFVDSTRLPGPLKVVAEWNPVSTLIQAARELFGNTSPAMPRPAPGRSSTRCRCRCSGRCCSWRCSRRWPRGSTRGPSAGEPLPADSGSALGDPAGRRRILAAFMATEDRRMHIHVTPFTGREHDER